MKITPVILCGGSGTRLWPMSRVHGPKQLQAIMGENSLFIETLQRLQQLSNCRPPLVICGQTHAEAILESARLIKAPIAAIIEEPVGRGTAAAAACASLWAQGAGLGEDALVLLPADHYVDDRAGFAQTITEMATAARAGYLATAAIAPTAPETGFGYIKIASTPLAGLEAYAVEAFVEKPNRETAQAYIEDGHYYWNSGMFAFPPSLFLEELDNFAPDIARTSKLAWMDIVPQSTLAHATRFRLNADSFGRVPSLSIDYAVMEHTRKATATKARFGWSDVGSWQAVFQSREKDDLGNAVSGNAIWEQTQNCFIKASDRLVATLGLDGIAIIDTPDAVLVASLDQVQNLKAIHQTLGQRAPALHHGVGSPSWEAMLVHNARSWLFDTCLPYWADTGLDRDHGGAIEALSHDGTPLDRPKRVMVQARQAYVFAHASHLGFAGGLEAMASPLDFLLRFGDADDSGQFAHVLDKKGAVIDTQTNAYDHAFILFALAWCWRVTGDPALKQKALQTLRFMNTHMTHPSGGYVESIPNHAPYRRANPHMHLLEAALEWVEIAEDEEFLDIAHKNMALFDSHFTHNGVLMEYFTDDLAHLPPSVEQKWQAIEPGHLYEWTYLLRQYARLTGEKRPIAAMLEAFADTYGHAEETGLVLDQILSDGSVLGAGSSRLWPQTEFIRLKLDSGKPADRVLALQMLERLQKHYLTFDKQQPGWWYDRRDAQGRLLSEFTPASSMYHIFGALAPLV